MIKTIIFDLGGVYLNRGLWKFRKYLINNFDVTDEQTIEIFIKKYYKPYFSGRISEKEFWEKSLKDLGIDEGWKKLRDRLLNFFELQEGMSELINKLRENYSVGLLSDQTNEWWPYLDEKYNISNNFDFTIISAETGYHKPQKEIYELALNEAGSKPEECIYIDDLEKNLDPAEKLGMKTILFKNPKQIKKELESFGIL